jgi:hypothetical protein
MVGVFTDQFNEKVGENTNLRQNIFALQMPIISSAVCKTPAGSDLQSESFTIRICNPIFTMLTIKQIY